MPLSTLAAPATAAPPLFAGQYGALWPVTFTALGLPRAARLLPPSLQAVVSPSVHRPLPIYSRRGILQGPQPAIGGTVNHAV
jgi:hypothetical protein